MKKSSDCVEDVCMDDVSSCFHIKMERITAKKNTKVDKMVSV
jgi:hypothetical protein